jgi:hypothetical protein
MCQTGCFHRCLARRPIEHQHRFPSASINHVRSRHAPRLAGRDKLIRKQNDEDCPLADQKNEEQKHEETFRVIDRRPFTSEGELRPEIVEEEKREARLAAAKQPPAPLVEHAAAAAPSGETPKRSAAFENLVRMIGSNTAMVLGAYADPRTGQPMIDPDAAREMIDMLDALQEKTKGNLAPEEDTMLLDLLGKLKVTYLEVNQAIAAQATAQPKAKTRA